MWGVVCGEGVCRPCGVVCGCARHVCVCVCVSVVLCVYLCGVCV